MSRKGNKTIAPRSKSVRGCRLIWHSLSPKEVSQVLKAYKGCPYFALMSEQEYDGTAFEACPIVIQLYPKSSHKEAISPFLWYHIYSAPVQCETPPDSFFLQLSGRSKVRLGFASHEAQRWFDTVRFDLDNQGILSNDERTNGRMSDMFDASDTDGRSPAGHRLSPGPQANCSPTMMSWFYMTSPSGWKTTTWSKLSNPRAKRSFLSVGLLGQWATYLLLHGN